MGRHEYDNDHDDDLYEVDDHEDRDDDRYYTETSTRTISTSHTESDYDGYHYTGTSTNAGSAGYSGYDNDDHYYTGTSTNNLNDSYARGYQFAITNGTITGITEIERGYAQQERIEYGETWSVIGSQVIKTEIEHGFTQTSIYADTNGDGIFTKVSQAYSPLSSSTAVNTVALNSIQGGSDSDDVWNGSSSSDNYYGAVGNDLLRGGYGDDDLFGGNDDDDLYGDDGHDHLYGSNGDDHLYGGNDIDEAYYEGNHHEYSLIQAANAGIQLIDSNTLRDGIDILESVERIHFADVSLALDADGLAGQAYRLYKAAFDRESDDSGLGYWMAQLENGVTLNSVANAFVASDEFQELYGHNVSDEEFVNLLYNNVLDRDADAGGYTYWVSQLDHSLTRADVLTCFSESAENQSNVAELIASGVTYQEWIG